MFADAVVDALVVAAEDNQVVERREAVGFVLVVADAVGRGVDHLVVFPFRFEGFDAAVDRFDLHYHTRLSAEGVVVRGAVLVFCVVPDVVDMDFDQPLLLRTLEDRFVQRRGEQFGYDGQDVYSHGVSVLGGR